MNQSELIEMLRLNKQGSYNHRRRRHPDWSDNYTLYRDKVITNRLNQRQSVNVPLMKTAVKTLLKDIDDAPILYFTNLDNDDQAEVYYNEYWKFVSRENHLVIKDLVDKRQVLLFGRSFKMLDVANGVPYWEIVDPQDILIDRYVDPSNLDSARFIIHEHLYTPLASLRSNPIYDNAAVRRLQEFYASDDGLVKAEQNQLDFVERNRRMAVMGVIDIQSPILGETYVELNQHFVKIWDEQLKEDVIWLIVIAEAMEILFMAPLEDVIGDTRDHYWRNHYPISSWGDETERTDFWNDGVCDTLRQPNKILNAWFSQLVENRTLRNYGMNYYNSMTGDDGSGGFSPQTWTPGPWAWFPVPGDPNQLIKHVDVPELKDEIDEMQFIITIAEKASAATTVQQGETSKGEMTLGEVKLLISNAEERVKSMAIYYTESWADFGLKYVKLVEAVGKERIDAKTIHRRGRLTKKMYTAHIGPKDWETELGYTVEVKNKNEKEQEDQNSLQWLNAARSIMPNNPIVDEEYKKKILENSKMNSDAIQEALKFDKQQSEAMRQQMMGQLPQVKPPTQLISLKDIPSQPNQGQQQMLGEVGIQANGGKQNPTSPAQPMQQPAAPQLPAQVMQNQPQPAMQ